MRKGESRSGKMKKGKKSGAALAAARLEAEEKQRILEEKEELKRREDVEREANLLKRESEIERREKDCTHLEEEARLRLQKIESEVAERSQFAISVAERRAHEAEARADKRQKECEAREHKLAQAESEYRVLKIEIEAREQALGQEFTGGVAKRLNQILVDQAENRDALQARERSLDQRQNELETRELALETRIKETEERLNEKEDTIKQQAKASEEYLAKQEFTARQRARRRLAESEAVLASHQSECEIRDRKLKAREEEITRRNRELLRLSRKLRKQDIAIQQQFKTLSRTTITTLTADEPHASDLTNDATDQEKSTSMKSPLTGFYRPTTAPYAPGNELGGVPQSSSDFHINTLLNRIDSIKAEIVQEVRTPYAARRLPPSSRNRPKSAAKYGTRSAQRPTPNRPQSASCRIPEAQIPTTISDCQAPPDVRLDGHQADFDADDLF